MIIPGQFRLSQIQVYNWGTFSGLHTVDVARTGFLITGPSGSGKSTLIDAVSTILVSPTKRRFNAAAAADAGSSGGSGRTLITYARGAWRREHAEDVDELTRSLLRTGATWTGVGLRYEDGRGGIVTAVRLMYLSANAHAAADIVDLYVLLDRAADLREFEQLAHDGLDIRVARKQLNGALAIQRTHPRFINALRKRLGIADPAALELLHTTQSAKTLGDLNHLMRHFMLPEPATFRKAETAVENFTELQAAHLSVETAREQIEQLTPIRDADQALSEVEQQRADVEDQDAALEQFTLSRRIDFARADAETASAQAAAVLAEKEEAEAAYAALAGELGVVTERIHGAKGVAFAQAENRRDNAVAELARVRAHRESFAQTAALLDAEAPDSAEAFTELRLQLGELAEELERDAADGLMKRQDQAFRGFVEAENAVEEGKAALAAIRRYRSSMDRRLLEARALIAEATGIATSQLPFIADLIYITPGEEDWQPVAERVMGGFARRILVDEEHYALVAAAVNAHHLGARVDYVRFTAELAEVTPQRFVPGSLGTKITVRPGRYERWLQAQLSREFDHEAVDTVEELRAARRAVTREGQVKVNAHRHIKDDRSRIDDRSRWVLSGNIDDKIDELTRLQRERVIALTAATQERDSAKARIARNSEQRHAVADLLRTEEFHAINVEGAAAELERAQATLDELADANVELKELHLRERALTARAGEAKKAVDRLLVRLGECNKEAEKAAQAVAGLAAQLEGAEPLAEAVAEALTARFTRHDRSIRADNVDKLSRQVRGELSAERDRLRKRASSAETRATTAMVRYLERWPARSGDLSAELSYRGEFLTELDRLERDDLPRFADRFRQMQRDQTHRYLGEILRLIRTAAREIRNSVESINESLQAVEFYPGTHLRIEVREAQPAEARTFVELLSETVDGVLADDTLAAAESRFAAQQKIIEMMRVSDATTDRQLRLRLDTREHVKFLGVEVAEDGTRGAVYDSAEGLSGGQAQKLSSFCLAAALRYQLTAQGLTPAQAKDSTVVVDGVAYPRFGTVILDEAFDRADTEFTRAAMEAFRTFGFHLILATPEKLLQTVQDYIGGVLMVDSPDRKHSLTSTLTFEETGQGATRPPAITDAHAR